MFMNEGKFSSINGEEMAVQFSRMTCSSDQLLHHHHSRSNLINWDHNSMVQNSISESSSFVSSPAMLNVLVSADGTLIKDQFPNPTTTLGSLFNAPSCSAPLASYTKLNHFQMDQNVKNDLPDSGNSIKSCPHLVTFTNDPTLDERAVRFSGTGLTEKCEFNGTDELLSQSTPSMGSGKHSIVSSKQTFKAAESLVCSQDEDDSTPALEWKFGRLQLSSIAHETANETSGLKKMIDHSNVGLIISDDTTCRKRKAIAKGKPKDLPSSSSLAKDVKDCKSAQTIEDENSAVKLNQNRNMIRRQTDCNVTPQETSKDYIHVRARRGQATDSHSLAEKVRREKINKRMKLLQDLVPGCHKITGKAVMLDEIINYVQSLQRQVQFLSMKLATVNPRLDFNVEALASSEDMLHRSVLEPPYSKKHQQGVPATQSCFSNGIETRSIFNPIDHLPIIQGFEGAPASLAQTGLQNLVQTHFGKMQIQDMEFSSQSSYGSPPT